jgi:Protein of unknown function (DUF2281)
MTIETAILDNVGKLPEAMKQSVLLYSEFLASQYQLPTIPDTGFQTQVDINPSQYGFGSLAGQIIMSDDFDEPLEDLQDYM